jgi:manganese transport protein
VGTTIVPYNVFLGSGISKGQTVPLMRIGLTISVIIGGLITAAILIAGTAVKSFSNFNELAAALTQNIGPMGGAALGIGLFAAGFSSAITSPYAASIIASTVFSWGERGQRLTWMLVLLIGFAFGISDIKPIPVILAVQALNGLVLPLLTAYLILLINDPLIIPKEYKQSKVYNAVLVVIFGAVLLMGLNNVDKSVSAWLSISSGHFTVMLGITASLVVYITYKLFASRAY